jgi:hypothetical protein
VPALKVIHHEGAKTNIDTGTASIATSELVAVVGIHALPGGSVLTLAS